VSGWFHPLQTFHINWSLPVTSGGIVNALFLGFSAAMLGISGFESSSNFVEEQEQGVSKTLRNMCHCFFNPMIALLLICIIPLAEVGEQESLLAFLDKQQADLG
jgi:amino acid transporter